MPLLHEIPQSAWGGYHYLWKFLQQSLLLLSADPTHQRHHPDIIGLGNHTQVVCDLQGELSCGAEDEGPQGGIGLGAGCWWGGGATQLQQVLDDGQAKCEGLATALHVGCWDEDEDEMRMWG